MRILVTGATGFIGRHLVRFLAAPGRDATVTILTRTPPPPNTLPAPVRAVRADLRDRAQTAQAVQDAAPDVAFHLAAAGVTAPFLDVDRALAHNVTGTLNLIRACFADGATPRLVVARTPGERNAINVYAASKAAAWQFCRMYARTKQWPIGGAVIFQAYGPGQPEKNLIPAALAAARAGRDFPMTAGTQKRDWIYVDDVVRGLVAAAEAELAPGVTVDLGTGRVTSVADVVQQIYALVDGSGKPVVGALPARPGDPQTQVADVARTRTRTGWQAAIPLKTGLKRLLNTPY